MEKYYPFAESEAAMRELWRRSDIYRFDAARPGAVFSIDTPPPTVSGDLHIGHVFSYVQTEIIARFKRMTGHNVFFPFGFDDNGLPTERLVERETGLRAGERTRTDFIHQCVETAARYEETFKELWTRLGFSADWSLTYQTAGTKARRISQRYFLALARAGKAYQKESPVLWCTECRSSIAQAELETRETDTVFYTLWFEVNGEKRPVATTRPELLYGCVCLFVHPLDERYAGLDGQKATVPLFDFEVPVYYDEQVDREKGSGIVMCATYGDAVDVYWAGVHHLPYRRVLKSDGTVENEVPYIGGLRLMEAREKTVVLLRERGLLAKAEPLTHTIGVHERCGTPVEWMPSRQWYIEVLSDKARLLRAAGEINWYPSSMKTRYLAWVENLKWDWCISRQRYYGVPIPVWYCADCGAPLFPADEDLPVDPMSGPGPTINCGCGGTAWVPEAAVLDTWATSSLTPFINACAGEQDDRSDILYPMSLHSQAHEIIRTWAFYSVVRGLFHTNRLPWKDIMISGFVLSKPGEKMSKSKNNAGLSPQALMEKWSADALRYWSAGARLGTDMYFDEEELTIAKRFMTKLWNACRFALPLLADFDPAASFASAALLPQDYWLLMRVKQTTAEAHAWLEMYETGAARHVIDAFFWNDFCDFYIELVKSRLYEPESHGFNAHDRLSGQYALYHTLLSVLKLYAPFTPYITEYIYQQYFRPYEQTVSLHLLLWDMSADAFQKVNNEGPWEAFGECLKKAVEEARKYKTENKLPRKAEMASVSVAIPSAWEPWLALCEGDLRACTGAKQIRRLYLDA